MIERERARERMAGGGGEEEKNLYTPTWVIAVVYTVVVAVSFAVERCLYYGGVFLEKKKKKSLNEALQKVKEELMLLGFSSLLLTVSEKRIIKICVSPDLTRNMLPCWRKPPNEISRLRLAEGPPSAAKTGYCANKNKVPLLSLKAIDDLHIFIFTLAVIHVIYCVLTVLIGSLKIRQWKPWEDSVAKENHETEKDPQPRSNHVLMVWLHSFWKQFYGSVNKSDYVKLNKASPKVNFHQHMIEAIEDDFKQVFGISWYLWIFVVIFIVLSVNGWNTYFWIAFIPFLLLLAVGTKLEHVLMQLVHEVAVRHAAAAADAIESQSNVDRQSDNHFWFHWPRFVLFLIHFILFQNSFEIAFFFWIWLKAAYSFDACVMGELSYIVVRLVIGVFIQVHCSYNTLPLYALVTQV